MNTMKVTKTLMLAAVSALSIGVGAAMAQSETPSMPTLDYWSTHTPVQAPAGNATVQSGSSDIEIPTHQAFDYSDLANPG